MVCNGWKKKVPSKKLEEVMNFFAQYFLIEEEVA
jgi:hypothetical protein